MQTSASSYRRPVAPGFNVAPITTAHNRNHRTSCSYSKAPCTRFSTSAVSVRTPQGKEVTTPLVALSPAMSIVILGFCTHIRQTLLGPRAHNASQRSLTSWHHRAPNNILPYPTLQLRHPKGYLAVDLPIPELRFRPRTSHTPTF